MVRRFLFAAVLAGIVAPSAWAAFPQVASVGYSEELSNTSDHDVVMPSGLTSGDLLLFFQGNDSSVAVDGTTIPSGWTQLDAATLSACNGEIWYKTSDGGESNFTYNLVGGSSQTSTNRVFRITGWHGTTTPETTRVDNDTPTTDPDPGSLDPSGWGTEDTLWIASWQADNGIGTTDGYPTNYSDNQFSGGATTGGGHRMSISTRELNAASEDPGAYSTSGSDDNVVFTVAVRPGAAAAAPPMLPLLGVGP